MPPAATVKSTSSPKVRHKLVGENLTPVGVDATDAGHVAL